MIIPEPVPIIPSLTFFGDASSRDREFMVAGGLAIAGTRIKEVEDHIAALRDDFGLRSEFHWKDYRGGQRKAAYEALIQYGFELVHTRKAALHVIIAPFKKFNHRLRDNQNKDTSINMMYYQHSLHRLCRFYGKTRSIHIRLDAGNDSHDICEMRNQLSADGYKKYQTLPYCVKSIEPVNSELVGSVQLADVIIGGIAANRNKTEYKANSPKLELSNFVLRASGRANWTSSTPPEEKFLTVWNFKVPHVPS